MMVPRALATRAPHLDVVAAMADEPRSRAVSLKVASAALNSTPTSVENDPYAEVEV